MSWCILSKDVDKSSDLTWCILSKDVDKSSDSAATEGAKKDVDNEQSTDVGSHPDLFEENFKELKKWVEVKTSKYGILLVTCERRSQRLGTALKVFSFKSDIDCCMDQTYRFICYLVIRSSFHFSSLHIITWAFILVCFN